VLIAVNLVKKSRAPSNTSSQSYGMSLAMSDHTMLPATRHQWTHLARGWYSIYLPRRDERL